MKNLTPVQVGLAIVATIATVTVWTNWELDSGARQIRSDLAPSQAILDRSLCKAGHKEYC